MARAVILAATVAALICLYLDQPKPVQAVEVPYCKIWAWRWIDIGDQKVKLWYETFGLCSEMDRYEYI